MLTHLRALIVITYPVFLSELVPPNVAIAATGAQNIGVSYNMNCTVNVMGLLIPNTMIQWVKKPPNNTIPSPITANTTSIHYIEALNTSDAGLYTCIATIKLSDIGITVQGNDSHIIALKSKMMECLLISFSLVLQPSVSVSLSRETDLLAGSSLNITCSITLDPKVNTPVNIVTEWSPVIRPNNRVIIDNVNQYQSVLYFTSLSELDGETYQCSVNVASSSDYVTQADNTSNTTSLIVTSKTCNTSLYTAPSILIYRSNDWKYLSIAHVCFAFGDILSCLRPL